MPSYALIPWTTVEPPCGWGVDVSLRSSRATGGWLSFGYRWVEGWVVVPVVGNFGVAEVGFVAPEDLMPVGAAGLDVVFMDEVPDDLFKGDAAGGEMEAGEGSFKRVVIGRGEEVEVAARIRRLGAAVVLVDKDRLRVVEIVAGLVPIGRSQGLEARRSGIGTAIHTQRHLNVQVHPVAEPSRPAATRGSRHAVSNNQRAHLRTKPSFAELSSRD